jgi:hypothetical protein
MNRTLPTSATYKTWVAEITGTHEKFDLDRRFIKAEVTADGRLSYELVEDLVYEICCPVRDQRHFTVDHQGHTYYLPEPEAGR